MKKVYLKKWVEVVLVLLLIGAMLVLGGECNNFTVFVASKVIAIIIIFWIIYILIKYGRFE